MDIGVPHFKSVGYLNSRCILVEGKYHRKVASCVAMTVVGKSVVQVGVPHFKSVAHLGGLAEGKNPARAGQA